MKRLIALSLACFLLAPLLWWAVQALRHDVLVLQDGRTLSVDGAWEVGDSLFYRQGDELDVLDRSAVRRIVEVRFDEPETWPAALSAHFRHSLGIREDSGEGPPAGGRNRLAAAAAWLVFAAVLAGAGWIVLRRRARPNGKQPRGDRRTGEPGARPYGPRLAGFEDVESLFADLFRHQVGAPETQNCRIEPVSEARRGKGRIYNLQVEHEGTTRSRRMTIAPIGENTGSKSQCFSVLYDHPIVVKVPPDPITRLSAYYDGLRSEFAVRKKLAPRECVIPGLSVICRKLHKFPDVEPEDDERLELRYMQWLEEHPEHQRFLKIGGGFAFFMDLTRYFFLSQVIEPFHDLEEALRSEKTAAAGAMGSPDRFEDRYGPEGAELFGPLQEAWENFQEDAPPASPGSGAAFNLGELRERFVGSVVETSVAPDSPEVSGRVGPFPAHTETARSFRALLEAAASNRLFERNAPLMGEMGANLLDLLAWLYEKRVAIRDLKPDNLLVAGDRSAYPQFLASADQYVIGLIDLETAVDCSPSASGGIAQPQLGGTPLYGTPSHLFPNEVLQGAHEDLALVLHIQDWYAVTAIFFEIVTGEALFRKPARLFPHLLRRIGDALRGDVDLPTVYREASTAFWPAARQAVEEGLHRYGPRLDRVFVRIPDSLRARLFRRAGARTRQVRSRVDRYLDEHELFRQGANRERLQRCTAEEVVQLREKYGKSRRHPKLEPLLDGLVEVKRKAERSAALEEVLDPSANRVRASDLVLGMFEVVADVMQPGDPSGAASELAAPADLPESNEGLRYTITVSPAVRAEEGSET